MATGAVNLMFQSVFEGSLSMCDMDIERRPYHRNCECALHRMKGRCPHAGSQQSNFAFPKREFGNNFSFPLSASTFSSQSSCVHNSSIRSRDGMNEGSINLVAEGNANVSSLQKLVLFTKSVF